jgi:hypothetical protein
MKNAKWRDVFWEKFDNSFTKASLWNPPEYMISSISRPNHELPSTYLELTLHVALS